MAYASIAKLENFTGKEDDTQTWINDVSKAIIVNNWDNARALQVILYFLKETANSWYQSLATRPQTFQQFKTAFLGYFSNNNSINCLANTFTTIKQNNTKAVTTYLGHFHRVLHQIQAINAVYFTKPQILNQFICGLRSNILQHVCPLHSANLQATVTYARDFESAELEANHTQAINLVMNRSSDLNSKLKQINDTINQKIEEYLANNHQLRMTQQALTNNIPPAIITNDELLVASFLFDLEETIEILLFSGAALEKKPITAMYMDAKIDDHAIKLILDSGLAGSIITKQLMDQLGHRVD
ncbi:hypothetical protein G9A89_011811 [Geosiphon pyriformis]|nr:hypothetical protein G9A89_011811 [Geosiphon pyriformis]